MIRQKQILLPLYLLVLVASCKQKDTIHEESLYGKWDIVHAQRNGKETPYLRGGYFVIEKEGRIVVNINGTDEASTYTLDKGVIRTKDDRTFVLQNMKPDSMTVHFEAGPQSDFIFYMVRHHDTNQ